MSDDPFSGKEREMSWIRKAAGGRGYGGSIAEVRDHGSSMAEVRDQGNCMPKGKKAPARQKEKKYADGYLTVFLTLSITVLLPLVLTLVEGARINAIRMKYCCPVGAGRVQQGAS